MSTILKALRRLEREKSVFEARPLQDEIAAVGPPVTRRRLPLLALMAATAVVGLALGASLLYWWSRDMAAGTGSHAAAAPAPAPVAKLTAPTSPTELPPVPVGPPVVAAQPAAPEPAPAPVVAAPEAVAPVASAPPPAAFASPVEVIERPAPTPAVEPAPEPKPAPAPVAVAPAIRNDAPPAPGELPPYDYRARQAKKAASAAAPSAAAPTTVARASATARAEAPPAPAASIRRKTAAPAVVRANVPDVLVSSTVWHPQRDRRVATVTLAGSAPKELHEGDAIGPLVVSVIEPSGVVFLHDGVELRRRVGAKN